MKNLSYVFSAPAMLRLQPCVWAKENPEDWLRVRASIASSLDVIRRKTTAITGETVLISLLFNAFTEDTIGQYINDMDRYGFDQLYADSGGLQMVTTNKTITPQLKSQIYGVQKLANFGFCFDEIPLGLKEGVDPETGKHRSQTASKLFRQGEFDACIASTAQNIKEQTEAFMGSSTKAFYILQGNSSEEMYRWFEGGTKVLGAEHYAHLQGLAPADTCIGNGEMESVEMLSACHRLRNDFGAERTGNHIHFLGVGSPSRLLPALYLSQGGYLDPNIHVSFDSSTASMSLIMGNLTSASGRRVRRGILETVNFMMEFYDDMHDVVAEFCGEVDREEFYQHALKNYKSIADMINLAPPQMAVWVRAAITVMPLWQVTGFFQQAVDRINAPESQYAALGFLREVKTEDDMQAWRRQFSKYLKSSRIDRVNTNVLQF